MTDRDQLAIDPGPADLSARLEEAIHNLSLGIVIFDSKRHVIFCNRRYMQMYGLTPEQVKPGHADQRFDPAPPQTGPENPDGARRIYT